MHGVVGALFAQREFELFYEDAVGAERGERPVQNAIALRRDLQDGRDETVPRERRHDVPRLPHRELARARGDDELPERFGRRRGRGRHEFGVRVFHFVFHGARIHRREVGDFPGGERAHDGAAVVRVDDGLRVIARLRERLGRASVGLVVPRPQFLEQSNRERRRTSARVHGERQGTRPVHHRRRKIARLGVHRVVDQHVAFACRRDDRGVRRAARRGRVDERGTRDVGRFERPQRELEFARRGGAVDLVARGEGDDAHASAGGEQAADLPGRDRARSDDDGELPTEIESDRIHERTVRRAARGGFAGLCRYRGQPFET